jgi:hypothetical protein
MLLLKRPENITKLTFNELSQLKKDIHSQKLRNSTWLLELTMNIPVGLVALCGLIGTWGFKDTPNLPPICLIFKIVFSLLFIMCVIGSFFGLKHMKESKIDSALTSEIEEEYLNEVWRRDSLL